MYCKKKLIFVTPHGKPLVSVNLLDSGDKLNISVKNKTDDFDGFFVCDDKNSHYFSTFPVDFDFKRTSGKIECAVLKKQNIVALKNEDGTPCNKIKKAISEYFNAKNEEKIEQIEQKSEEIIEETVVHNEEIIETNENQENSFSQKTELERAIEQNNQIDEIVEREPARDKAKFYCSVKPNLDEMFVVYPKDEILEHLIPDSTWVKVKREDGHYVVGLIRESATPRYVCYGVPSEIGNYPPDSMKKYCQWLPTTPDEQQGYWIVFQDANTGETLCEE